MISQDMVSDEHFNSISIEAQCVFLRMLSVSDDCGVVPANTYKLNVLINTPPKLAKRVQTIIDEIVAAGLGNRFVYKSEQFFAFKQKSFQDYQSYILKKATKSEYLRIPKEEFDELSGNFQEVLGKVIHIDEGAVSTVESIKQRVESSKQREGGVGGIPPTEKDVEAYMIEIECPSPRDEASSFFDHYTSNGWRISGKTPMKDWKSACRNWKRNAVAGTFRGNGKAEVDPYKAWLEKEEAKDGKK